MDVSFAAALAGGMILGEQFRHGVPGTAMGRPSQNFTDYANKKAGEALLPMCPMIYAIITDTSVLAEPNSDNWNAPKAQTTMNKDKPLVPALVALDMDNISLNLDCHISTAFVTVEGEWNLKFLRKGTRCDCLLAVPMHRQGTVAGVEIDLGGGRIFATAIVPKDEAASYGAKGSTGAGVEDPGTYNPELFRMSFPQVDAGARLSLKITWFQTMEFTDGLYSVRVPFVFPDYVLPVGQLFMNVTKISCSINSGTHLPVEVGDFHHPMKETSRGPGRVTFTAGSSSDTIYGWYNADFIASYKVWSDGILPNLIVQDPVEGDFDPRGVFCLSVSPPDPKFVQGYQRAVIFLLDRSGSMSGKPMNDARAALQLGINMLQPVDRFNIIAFDHETLFFSPQLMPPVKDVVTVAQEWIFKNCESRGGTDIITPLQQAIQMLDNLQGYVPFIFLITDGAVRDERNICHLMQNLLNERGPAAPRISTFGIGHYCNYYFLKMLALIGRGLNDVAFNSEKIREQMEKMLVAASTPHLTTISLVVDIPGGCEIYPFPIPDLFCGNPLVVSGRFYGTFPSFIKLVGYLPDQSVFEIAVQMQRDEHIPLGKVFAKQQLDLLTAQAWLSQDRRLESQVTHLSIVTGLPCEYTRMVSFESTKEQHQKLEMDLKKGKKVNLKNYAGKATKIAIVGGLVIGFGSLAATAANLAIGGGLLDLGGDWFPDLGDPTNGFCCDLDCPDCGDFDICSCCCDGCDLSDSLGDLCNACDCGGVLQCFLDTCCGIISSF